MIRAAGAVLHRHGLVAVVHRPQYDDWTLPKGKLDPGEDDRTAAVREVEEETGHAGTIERDLGTVAYQAAAEPKTVRYFLMAADGGGRPLASDVDEVRWVGLDEAMAIVSYDRDREVLERARGSVERANVAVCGKWRTRPFSNSAKSANFPLDHGPQGP